MKPHSVKGQYVKGISVSATMSPSVQRPKRVHQSATNLSLDAEPKPRG